MESNGSGVVWFNATVIPASVVGNGITLALTGCDASTVFKPVTNNAVICPGATLMIEGSVYPVPDSVIPCPKIGARFMANSQIEIRGIWRIVGRLILKSRLDGKGSAFCGAFDPHLFQRPLWTRFQLQAGPLSAIAVYRPKTPALQQEFADAVCLSPEEKRETPNR
jgi:hypothetical protein